MGDGMLVPDSLRVPVTPGRIAILLREGDIEIDLEEDMREGFPGGDSLQEAYVDMIREVVPLEVQRQVSAPVAVVTEYPGFELEESMGLPPLGTLLPIDDGSGRDVVYAIWVQSLRVEPDTAWSPGLQDPLTGRLISRGGNYVHLKSRADVVVWDNTRGIPLARGWVEQTGGKHEGVIRELFLRVARFSPLSIKR